MKDRIFAFTGAFVIVVMLSTVLPNGISLIKARESRTMEEEISEPMNANTSISPMISYQGKLLENGSPVNGTRNMSFWIYDQQSLGTLQWSEGPKTVSVSNGIFHVVLGDTTPLVVSNFDQALWLEVRVGTTTLPRQRLTGVPYALSLSPGAKVSGNLGSGSSILGVTNLGSGQGIKAQSWGGGGGGAALWAENSNTSNGIAVWAKNNSGDTGLVVENQGSGALIKGFGSDGGDEDFRVDNDGSVFYEGALMGAFPRPSWNSGWVSMGVDEAKTLTHNVGGNPDNYFADLQCKDVTDNQGINIIYHGLSKWDSWYLGAMYEQLDASTITIYRGANDMYCDYVRVIIWVIK